MNVRRVRNFLILFLSVGLTSSAFALDTTALKDNCKPVGSAYGQQTASNLHTADQFNQAIGKEAQFFKKYKATHMVETTFKDQAKGTETVVQCFNFPSKRYATYAWVELVPDFSTDDTKFAFDRLFLDTKKKVAATARGEVLIRATTSDSDPYTAQKAANQTWIKFGSAISEEGLSDASGIKRLIKGKILGRYPVRVSSGPSKWPFRIFLHKVPVTSYRILMGKSVVFVMNWKEVSDRQVYTQSNTPNWEENRKPRAFVMKNNNRFRYYKVGEAGMWGIVGKYKNHILTIKGPGTPKKLKQFLEEIRIAYFFSVPKEKQK